MAKLTIEAIEAEASRMLGTPVHASYAHEELTLTTPTDTASLTPVRQWAFDSPLSEFSERWLEAMVAHLRSRIRSRV